MPIMRQRRRRVIERAPRFQTERQAAGVDLFAFRSSGSAPNDRLLLDLGPGSPPAITGAKHLHGPPVRRACPLRPESAQRMPEVSSQR